MRDFSTQCVRPTVEREELELDVLFVGAGPSNLAGLWRLLDRIEAHQAQPGPKRLEGLTIGLIEKADAIGEHAFSGAVLDPAALQELCPDYRERGFPVESIVRQEEIWLLTRRGGFRLPVTPPFMDNHGLPIISLSRMVRWMAAELEQRTVPGVDVMLLPGFAGMQVLWEEGRVVGVQTADKGVNADGTPRANFEPGNRLKAKVTVFGEGPRGSLFRELDEKLGLQAGAANPQLFETGAKEIWEIPEGRVPDGFVLHSTGWPQPAGESGGSFIYKMAGNLLAVGYVVSLDTRDPFVDAHLALQRFKTHPRIRPMLEGGRMVHYGAKALAIGGRFSMPRLAFPGGMLVGDAAQMINAARFKGIHLGMKSGMCAADAIAQALVQDNFSEAALGRYPQELLASWAGKELQSTRNFHQILAHGLNPGSAMKLCISLCTGGWLPGEPARARADAERTVSPQAYYGKAVKLEDLDPGVKFDGQPCITKLDDVYASGAMHDEHQPGHLKLVQGEAVCAACWTAKGSPCTAFCPAQVYEMRPEAGGPPKLVIAYSNCLHCKTCEIKCPEGNIVWTPPEGGGGPGYKSC